MGAETTGSGKISTLFNIWKISLIPNSPVAAELMKDPKMAEMIKAFRLATGGIGGILLFLLILKKRKKNKVLILKK